MAEVAQVVQKQWKTVRCETSLGESLSLWSLLIVMIWFEKILNSRLLSLHFLAHIALVLEIEYRGYRGGRTKDNWEDQKAREPKNLIAEKA